MEFRQLESNFAWDAPNTVVLQIENFHMCAIQKRAREKIESVGRCVDSFQLGQLTNFARQLFQVVGGNIQLNESTELANRIRKRRKLIIR